MKQLEEVSREKGYNGFRNYATWYVALWIANDEDLYGLAQASAHTDIEAGVRPRYQHFADTLLFDPGQYALTGDGVRWNDPDLDIAALDAMIAELVEEDRHGLFPTFSDQAAISKMAKTRI